MKTVRLFAVAVLGLLSIGAVHAQVASLAGIEGTVLVSQGDAMAAGANGQNLSIGQRIVTTAGSKATIKYTNGCDVTLNENQRFVVQAAGNCAALIATIEGTGIAATAGGAAAGTLFAGGSGTTALAVTGVLGVAGLAAALNNRSSSASPF